MGYEASGSYVKSLLKPKGFFTAYCFFFLLFFIVIMFCELTSCDGVEKSLFDQSGGLVVFIKVVLIAPAGAVVGCIIYLGCAHIWSLMHWTVQVILFFSPLLLLLIWSLIDML